MNNNNIERHLQRIDSNISNIYSTINTLSNSILINQTSIV